MERDDSPGRLLHEVRWEAISSVPSELSSSTSDANSLFILFADSALGGDSYLEYLLSKQPNLKHAQLPVLPFRSLSLLLLSFSFLRPLSLAGDPA